VRYFYEQRSQWVGCGRLFERRSRELNERRQDLCVRQLKNGKKGSNKGPETSAAKIRRAELASQPKQELVLGANPKGDLLMASSLG
jgi:hypothetical protein